MSISKLEHRLKELERKIKCIPKVTQESINSVPDLDVITFPSNPCDGYIHMVEFKTSTNAWFFSYKYENDNWQEIISIVGNIPDISPIIPQPLGSFTTTQTREGYIQVGQSNGAWGLVEVIIPKPDSSFTLQILPGTTLSASVNVSNPDWNITETPTQYILTKTYPCSNLTCQRIGFTLTCNSVGSYNMVVTATAGTGNELNTANNSVSRPYSAVS